ncbi:hypothetical protein KEM55_003951, partial [Ascosphaera atra]
HPPAAAAAVTMSRVTSSRRRLTQYFIVGGNAVSAFLSWRLQATNSCDVTLVWKSGYEQVSQYGVSFKSKQFGNERFKPRHVVRTPEEGILPERPYDYVILCVKALPDVYDLASVIESVVTPKHTCILLNTSNTVGVEAHLETRFPANVILSLVSQVDLAQTGVSEFEHLGSSTMWVGPATSSPVIPTSIQHDMAAALAITLGTGQVDCRVSENIRQQQYERMIGPIAFHPVSVLFECPNHSQLLEKVGVRHLISGIIDELIMLAMAQGCSFSDEFKDSVIEQMTSTDKPSTMYQDFQARRPMEVEIYLGSPVKFAVENNVQIPRVETIYSLMHHMNITNQQRPMLRPSPSTTQVKMMNSAPPHPRGMANGAPRGPPRRGPPSNGIPRPPMNGPRATQTDPDEANFEEFSHLVLYDENENGASNSSSLPSSQSDLALRERELALRQRELRLKEKELQLRRAKTPSSRSKRYNFDDDDDDDDDDCFPEQERFVPQVDPDSIDMLSVTSRRNRRGPVIDKNQVRRDPESFTSRPPSSFSKYFSKGRKKQLSERIVEQMPTVHDTLWENPMMSYASNRFANVDRTELQGSRANSMTSNYPPPMSRRGSGHSPGALGQRGMTMSGKMPMLSQQDLYSGAPGPGPMPTMGSRRPSQTGFPPRPPPSVASAQAGYFNQVEQPQPQGVPAQEGVSSKFPNQSYPNVRSLTGSASASAGSGDSGSGKLETNETSATSSQVSLGANRQGLMAAAAAAGGAPAPPPPTITTTQV